MRRWVGTVVLAWSTAAVAGVGSGCNAGEGAAGEPEAAGGVEREAPVPDTGEPGKPRFRPPALAGGEGPPFELQGELLVIVEDDFEGRASRTELRVREPASGRSYVVTGLEPERLPRELRHGATVRVRGHLRNETELAVALEGAVDGKRGGAVEVIGPAPETAAAVTGIRDTLVIVADFQDARVTCGAAEVQASLFGAANSVDDLYREMTGGQLGFSGTVTGPYRIAARSTDACDGWGWASLADAQARAAGFDLAAYDHLVYVFPRNPGCAYAGVAYVGGNRSINEGYCGYEDIFAHELGHNLGLRHAASPGAEYGDSSDIMGLSGYPLRQVNAPHRVQMGWLDPARVVEVTGAGDFVLAPLELDPSATGGRPQVLKLAKPDTGDAYFLSYRQPIGYDANLASAWSTGLGIHRHTGTGTTTWLARLADGTSHVDTANEIVVTQLSHDANGVAIRVALAGATLGTRDTAPPTVPAGLAATVAKKGKSYRVDLRWSASTDDVGVAGYDVLRNGSPAGTTAATSFTSADVAKGATYAFTVRARDAAGNVSAAASPVSVTIPAR